ncbi:hypothetical protein LDJ79_22550, partial [Vibrio tritonius]
LLKLILDHKISVIGIKRDTHLRFDLLGILARPNVIMFLIKETERRNEWVLLSKKSVYLVDGGE